MALNEGDTAPDFTLATDGGGQVQLSALKGKKVVVYFYPKDDTPGCTKESCNFRDDHPKFQKEGVEIIGISKDSVESHDQFKAKFDLNFTLAADPDLEAIKAYGVWVEKEQNGEKSMGVNRSTFLIDAEGKLARAWRGVNVDGHADEVFEAAKGI
jgi:thioredoxin-dependent peroxiredoxin